MSSSTCAVPSAPTTNGLYSEAPPTMPLSSPQVPGCTCHGCWLALVEPVMCTMILDPAARLWTVADPLIPELLWGLSVEDQLPITSETGSISMESSVLLAVQPARTASP